MGSAGGGETGTLASDETAEHSVKKTGRDMPTYFGGGCGDAAHSYCCRSATLRVDCKNIARPADRPHEAYCFLCATVTSQAGSGKCEGDCVGCFCGRRIGFGERGPRDGKGGSDGSLHSNDGGGHAGWPLMRPPSAVACGLAHGTHRMPTFAVLHSSVPRIATDRWGPPGRDSCE